jgi:hypothetical protein
MDSILAINRIKAPIFRPAALKAVSERESGDAKPSPAISMPGRWTTQ